MYIPKHHVHVPDALLSHYKHTHTLHTPHTNASFPPPPPPQDLLSALLTSVDDTGVGMSDIALRDELMTLLVAGQETSAILLGWTAALLAHHPVTQQRVVGELQRVLGGRLPTLDDMR